MATMTTPTGSRDATPDLKSAGKKAKGWTDAEKVKLFAAIIESQGVIDWKKVKLPEGRTQKACLHIIDRLRKDAKLGDSASPTTAAAVGPKATGKQGKAAGRKNKAADDDEEDDNEEEHKAAKKTAVAGKGAKRTKVKAEPKEEDEDDS